jgi:hypothetical protein
MESAMNQPSSKPMQSSTDAVPMEDVRLDCDHALTHAGGDPELLMQLCNVFLHELPICMESLRSAIKLGHEPGAERALQRLRNCLILFGSGPVSRTAETLEAAVRAKRVRRVRQEWKRLECQLQILVPQVQRLMLEISTPRSPVQ